MDDLAKLGIKVDASEAGTAAQLMDKLTASAKGTATSAELVETAFTKLMQVLGPAAVAKYLYDTAAAAVNLQDEYVRLSEVAGTLPSTMQALDLPARLAGTSLDSVAMAIARLSKNIGDAQAGNRQSESILKILGIDITGQQDPADQFVQLSKTIMGMSDASVQAYATMTLLGRSFAEMKPLMKEVADAGGIHATQTDEEIRAAKEFKDTLTKLNFELEQGKIQIVNNYLPQLKDVAQSFREGYAEGGLFVGVLKAIQMWQVGSDLHNANKDIVDFTEKLQDAQNQLQRLKKEDADYRKQNPDGERQDFNATAIAQLQKFIDQTQLAINARLAWKKELEGGPGIGTGAKQGAKPDGMDIDAINAVIAEAQLKAQMERKKNYDQQVADVKGFVDQYSAAIDTQNTLTKEAYKRNEITEEEQTAQLGQNEADRLTVQRLAAEQLEDLAKGINDPAKAREAAENQKKVNAQIVGNEAATASALVTIAYQKIKAYQDAYAAAYKAGEGVFNETKTAEQREKESYQKRKEQLAVFLADNRDMGLDAKAAEEQLEYTHQAALLNIELNKHQAERSMLTGTWQLAGQLMDQLGAKSKVAALAAIAISKGLAMAQVVQQTAVARMQVMADPTILAPAKPAALAFVETMGSIQLGLIAASGLLQAASVGSGGGGASVGGGSSGGALPTFNANPVTGQPAGSTPQSEQTAITINFNGHILGTQDFVDQTLIPAIKDAIDNRDFVIIGPNSRQASNITGG